MYHALGDIYVYSLVEKLKGKDHLVDIGVHGRLILKWILHKWSECVD
jgi:hypothetical protein